MLAFDRNQQPDLTSKAPHRIRVIGVGGAGVNMLDRLKLNHIDGMDLTVANTDQRALQASVVEDRLQLGRELTMGLGAGGDPEVGRQAASASLEDLKQRVQERDLVFLCGGLGGGTGSGSLALLAQLARESGAFVVAFVTMPFSFEGRRRVQQAEAGLTELQRHCHALLTFQNNRMGELIKSEEGIHSAFANVDQLISSAVSSIAGMVSRPGLIRLGLDDLIAALADNRKDTLFGWGEARGEKRATELVRNVLKSPLLDKNKLLRQARTVLVHISGGPDLSLFEVESVMQELSKQLHPDALLLFGTAIDPKRDGLGLTVISSLSEETMLPPAGDGQDAQEKAPKSESAASLRPFQASAQPQPSSVAPSQPEPEPSPAFNAPATVPNEIETAPTFAAESPRSSEPIPEPQPILAEENFAEEPFTNLEATPSDEPSFAEPTFTEPVSEAPPAPAAAEVEAPVVPEIRLQAKPRPQPEREAFTPIARLSSPASEAAETVADAPVAAPPVPTPAPVRRQPESTESVRPPVARIETPTPPPPPVQTPQPLRNAGALEPAEGGNRPASDLFESGGGRGRFNDSTPTVEDGEDLDLPTFLRRRK